MVSLKQEFELYDYFGPVAVALLFAIIVLLISFFILNFFFISKYDEPTVFERIASKHNLRLGPHNVEAVLSHKRYMKEDEGGPDGSIHDSPRKVVFTTKPVPEFPWSSYVVLSLIYKFPSGPVGTSAVILAPDIPIYLELDCTPRKFGGVVRNFSVSTFSDTPMIRSTEELGSAWNFFRFYTQPNSHNIKKKGVVPKYHDLPNTYIFVSSYFGTALVLRN